MNVEGLQVLLETLPPSKSIGISHASATYSSAVIVARKGTEKDQFEVTYTIDYSISNYSSSKEAAISIEHFLGSKNFLE